ncbi:MAG: hypothetical protein JZU53_01475 [Paludibacter sp.]|nr:hypothetical protein [Paludibacter sp.]
MNFRFQISIFLFFLISSLATTFAQQGFGTNTPDPSAVVDMTATNKGVLIPRVALTATTAAAPITAPAQGLMVYNTTTTVPGLPPGYYYWLTNKWVRFSDCATVSGLTGASIVFSGTPTAGIPYSGTMTVPYTNGNDVGYATGSTISSTNVTGLTATLRAGTCASSGGNLVYDITGVPSSNGAASFSIGFGGQSCSASLTVGNISVICPASAAFTSGSAIARSSYSGTLTIPYTGGNGMVYPGGGVIFSTGVTGLSATLHAGKLSSTGGTLVYDISGVPTTGGNALFAISIGGITCTVGLPVISVDALNFTATSLSSGSATIGSPYVGTMTIPYSGGSVSAPYVSSTIVSMGVTGLTATLQPDSLQSGNGSLTYYISGSAINRGNALFSINFGGSHIDASIPVIGNITLLEPTFPAGNAVYNSSYNGNLIIPYLGGTAGAPYPAININTPDGLGLSAYLPAGTLVDGAGSLIFRITGKPTSGGNAKFSFSFGGQNFVVNLPVVKVATLSSPTFLPKSATINTSCSGVLTISYTGGSGVAYPTDVITSTGITGLTATLVPNTLTTGTGTLTYNIAGKPTGTGSTANFTINFGGVTNTTVQLPVNKVDALTAFSYESDNFCLTNTYYTGNLKVNYTGGNNSIYGPGVTIESTGVTGLTATLTAGSLTNNIGGTLIYAVEGTPSSGGAAKFNINFGGSSITAVMPSCSGVVSVNGSYELNYGVTRVSATCSGSLSCYMSSFTATNQNLCFAPFDTPVVNYFNWTNIQASCINPGVSSETLPFRLPNIAELATAASILQNTSPYLWTYVSPVGVSDLSPGLYYSSTINDSKMVGAPWDVLWNTTTVKPESAGTVGYPVTQGKVRCVRTMSLNP